MLDSPKTKKAIIFTIATMVCLCAEALDIVKIMGEHASDTYWVVESLLGTILVIIITNLIAFIVRIRALLKVMRGDSIGKVSYIASLILRSFYIDLQILGLIMYVNMESIMYMEIMLPTLMGGVILLGSIAMYMDFVSRKENY